MEFTPTEVILKRAKAAASCPALRDTEAKNRALAAMAQALRTEAPAILAENAADLEASRGKVSDVMLDRLALNEARLEGMAAGIEAVAARSAGRWTNSSDRTAFASASAACRWALSPSSMRAARMSRRTPPRSR